jgi:hypothetical protein
LIFAKFDLDSTLINTDQLIDLALAEHGFMIDEDKRDKFHFVWLEGYEPPPDFQWDVFYYRLLTERLDELQPVDLYVNEFLESFKDPIPVITARVSGAIMHHACMKTLDKCFPNVEFSVTIVDSGDQKWKYMGQADIFFEDRRQTALDLSSRGNIVVMPNKCYNKISSTPSSPVIKIEDLEMQCVPPGAIIRYDDFGQVIDSNIGSLVSPI